MTVECHFKNIRQQILNEIANAKLTIQVAVAWFTNGELFEMLCKKAKQGVKVELIVINDYINNRFDGLKFEELILSGGDFYFAKIEEPMHHKFCIIDEQVLLNGSYNWTYYAKEINRENFQIFRNCNSIVDEFKKEFNSLKNDLKKNDKIIPISVDYIDLYDLQNAKNYLAKDLLIYANYVSTKKRFDEALNIVEKSRQFSLNNVFFIKATEDIERKIRIAKANLEQEIVNDNINHEIEQKSKQEDSLKSDEVKRLEIEAKIAYHKKQYGIALELYNRALDINPEYYDCLVGMGKVSWKTNNFEQLIKYAELVLTSSSGEKTTALNLFGLAYTDLKPDQEKASYYYDKCIEIDPENYVYYWNKSIVHNNLQTKTDCLNKVIEKCENDLAKKTKLAPGQMAVFAQAKNIIGQNEKAKELVLIAKSDFEQLNEEEKDYHDWDRIKTVMNAIGIT
jgi:tetratricopeptide (TPR) repeat protein